jgi:hypothetical protein
MQQIGPFEYLVEGTNNKVLKLSPVEDSDKDAFIEVSKVSLLQYCYFADDPTSCRLCVRSI